MEIKGKLHEVMATQKVTDSLKKREFVVEYAENAQYPEYLKFEAVNDRCALLDDARAGDEVEVHFNLRGRPWTDKAGKKSYFNSMQLWKLNILKTTAQQTYIPPSAAQDDNPDDLPF